MRKDQIVGSRLPSELIRDLEFIENVEQNDRSTTVRKLLYKAMGEWKLDYYAKLYADGKLSVARAAKECGVSIWEMLECLRVKKIPSQYDFEEWERDLGTVQNRVEALASNRKGPEQEPSSPGLR